LEDAPFLEKDPPPAVARGLSSILIALFALAAVVSVTVRVPETVSAPFALVPVRGVDPIRAPRKGSLTQARAVVGREVSRNDLLFEINSPEFADRFSEREVLDSTVSGGPLGLANARSRHLSEGRVAQETARALRDRVASLDRELSLKKEQLELLNEQLGRFDKLVDQGLTSLNERAEVQIRRSQAVLEMESLAALRQAARREEQKLSDAEAARLSVFREEERALLEKTEHARIRSSTLSSETPGGRTAVLEVRAPCNGTLTAVRVRSVGAVVLEGDILAEAACHGEALQAEIDAPQAGLSRIRAGQTVRFLFDAFPYQRYGTKSGKVRWASPAGLGSGPAAPSFLVVADLDDQTMRVGETSAPLLSGMRGAARVVVGRRTLIEYAFEPLRALRENVR
jgi:membrane fusion protein